MKKLENKTWNKSLKKKCNQNSNITPKNKFSKIQKQINKIYNKKHNKNMKC